MTGYKSKRAAAQDRVDYGSSSNYPPQPEQEPVAYYHPHKGFYWAKPTHISAPTAVDVPPVPLYVKWRAAQRPWVGLTTEDWYEFAKAQLSWEELLIAAETKLKEKNT